MVTDFYPLYFRGIRDEALTCRTQKLFDQTKGFVRLGKLISDRRLAKVRDRMPAATARITELWRDHDLLLTPRPAQLPGRDRALARSGRPADDHGMSNVYPYAATWNYTGPARPRRSGRFTDGGLPRSVMLIARPNDEAALDLDRRPARGRASLGRAAALALGSGWDPDRRRPIRRDC